MKIQGVCRICVGDTDIDFPDSWKDIIDSETFSCKKGWKDLSNSYGCEYGMDYIAINPNSVNFDTIKKTFKKSKKVVVFWETGNGDIDFVALNAKLTSAEEPEIISENNTCLMVLTKI